MIYRVVLNDSIPLYGLDIEDMILNPSLEVELNSSGSFSFTLSAFNSSMKENWGAPPTVLAGEIDVYEDDTIIWFGRPLEIGRDWNNNKVIKCEGALAYFNDTVLRPKEFDKNWWLFVDDDHDKGFFNYIIEQHNAQVTENHTKTSDREILVGDIIGIDNDNIYRQTDYNTVADALQQMCLDTNGGYFILRKEYVEEDGIRVAKRYIDWVKEPVGGTDQVAQFARNMVDLSQDLNGSDVVTVLIPTGEDDILINNSTIWDDSNPCPFNQDGFTFFHGSGSDELVWKEGYAEYGRILKQKDWNDISDKSVLQQRACEWIIDQMTEPVTIECTAADLHYINDKDYMIHVDDEYIPYMPFFLGQKVEVLSQPHGMIGDGPNGGKMVPIYKISINLDSGVKKMSIGTPPKRELTDIVKASGGSTRSSSSGTSSGGGSGSGGGSVTIPVKDVRVKKAGEEVYKSVVKKKIAKIDLSDLGGGDVEDVQIDGTSIVNEGIANIDSDLFGTKVVANPSDTPTDDLTSIKIGSTVYDIPGGGGGSGGSGASFTQELIFENDPMPSPTSGTSNVTRTYTLDKSIDDYDAVHIICYGYHTSSGNANIFPTLVFKKDYYIVGFDDNGYYQDSNTGSAYRMIMYKFTDSTHVSTFAMRSESGNEPILYKIYGLKFSSTIISPQIYSEQEREIGVWTDGKPLYQITYKNLSLSIPANTWTNTGIPFTNIDTYKVLYNKSENQGADSQYPMLYRFDNGNFQVFCQWAMPLNELTLQYTKTTDTPGSGTWTPKGAYTEVYSEDEILIGQWVDGKPLYEKTLILPNITLGRVDNLPHNIANVDHIHLKNWNFNESIVGHETSDQTYWAQIFYVTSTAISYRIGAGWSGGSNTLRITLQYTKTTDSTSAAGLPNTLISKKDLYDFCTYSTTEHIVGKWIDGSYIYERTWDLGRNVEFPNNAWTDAGLSNVPSIDKLVSSEAMQNDPCCVSIDVWYDNGTIKVRSLRIDTEVVRYLTLRYTKT